MGIATRLSPWPLRAALLALVAGGVALQVREGAKAGIEVALPRARDVLARAGYEVVEQQESWLGGKIVGRRTLIATHPACGLPILVWPMATGESLDVVRASFRTPPAYFFGDWSGSNPIRPMIVARTVAMRLRYALGFGRVPEPPAALIAVDDPSACMLLAPPQWRSIWLG